MVMDPAFLVGSALLLAVALVCVVPVLWRGARGTAIAALLMLPLAGGALYLALGTPRALDPAELREPQTLEEGLARLQRALDENPEDADGWMLLGNIRQRQGDTPAALEAWGRAQVLRPDDAELMVVRAEAMLMSSGERRIEGEVLALFERALALQPTSQRARWFLGIHHRQNARPAEAAELWAPLLASTEDPGLRASLREQIDLARAEAGLEPLPADAPAAADADAGPVLRVVVELDPALAERIAPDAVLFVIARAPEGPPMPVAVQRAPARDFPITVELSDAASPMPSLRFSEQARLSVLARVAQTGDAGAMPGDLASAPLEVAPTDGEVRLRVATVLE